MSPDIRNLMNITAKELQRRIKDRETPNAELAELAHAAADVARTYDGELKLITQLPDKAAFALLGMEPPANVPFTDKQL